MGAVSIFQVQITWGQRFQYDDDICVEMSSENMTQHLWTAFSKLALSLQKQKFNSVTTCSIRTLLSVFWHLFQKSRHDCSVWKSLKSTNDSRASGAFIQSSVKSGWCPSNAPHSSIMELLSRNAACVKWIKLLQSDFGLCPLTTCLTQSSAPWASPDHNEPRCGRLRGPTVHGWPALPRYWRV